MTRKLPPHCYVANPHDGTFSTDADVVRIQYGERGYYPRCLLSAYQVDDMNARVGAKPNHVAAMIAGSMFGWHVPAADPDQYDENGNLRTPH